MLALFLAALPDEWTGSITLDGMVGFLAFALLAYLAFRRSRHDG